MLRRRQHRQEEGAKKSDGTGKKVGKNDAGGMWRTWTRHKNRTYPHKSPALIPTEAVAILRRLRPVILVVTAPGAKFEQQRHQRSALGSRILPRIPPMLQLCPAIKTLATLAKMLENWPTGLNIGARRARPRLGSIPKPPATKFGRKAAEHRRSPAAARPPDVIGATGGLPPKWTPHDKTKTKQYIKYTVYCVKHMLSGR